MFKKIMLGLLFTSNVFAGQIDIQMDAKEKEFKDPLAAERKITQIVLLWNSRVKMSEIRYVQAKRKPRDSVSFEIVRSNGVKLGQYELVKVDGSIHAVVSVLTEK